MDPQSVEANFSLLEAGGNLVPGGSSWNEAFTEMTFTPDNLLSRDKEYTLQILGDATAPAWNPLWGPLLIHAIAPYQSSR